MTELLDSTVKKVTVHDRFCNLQDRIRHLFIDGLIVVIGMSLILNVVDYLININSSINLDRALFSILLIVYFLYYTTMEYKWGFTVGKWLNKTRVVSLDGNKPTFTQIIIRSITRLVPIGFVMIATPYQAFLNDILSKTRTVRIKKKKVVRVNEI